MGQKVPECGFSDQFETIGVLCCPGVSLFSMLRWTKWTLSLREQHDASNGKADTLHNIVVASSTSEVLCSMEVRQEENKSSLL